MIVQLSISHDLSRWLGMDLPRLMRRGSDVIGAQRIANTEDVVSWQCHLITSSQSHSPYHTVVAVQPVSHYALLIPYLHRPTQDQFAGDLIYRWGNELMHRMVDTRAIQQSDVVTVAEQFKADGFAGEIKIDSIGSGAGFERFCKTGESDIANASRGIKDAEVENCKAISRTPIEFRVGTDAIAVVVSKENTFLTDITLEQLAAIFSDKAEKWSDVDPSWPNEPILRFTPGTDSGTFDFFVEEVIQKPAKIEKLDEAKKIVLNAKNLQTSEDDNVLVKGIEGSPYAIGYFGFAYYQAEAANLKALSLNGVTPNFESAESGDYKLSRPLFIYSDAGVLKSKPQVAGFINYYLTFVNDVIGDVGYFPASEEALTASQQSLADALK